MSQEMPQRVLVIALNFAPELTGIGKYVGEMTEHLAARGMDVRVVTAPPYYPAWSVGETYHADRYVREQMSGADVWRCPVYVPRRPGGLSRILHLLSFGLSSLPVILWQAFAWRPQVVMVIEPPLACAPAAWLAARLSHAQAWLHVQDFEVDAAFGLGVLKAGWMRRAALAVESRLMRLFDRVTSISPRMAARLAEKGVPVEQIGLFPNWVDTDLIRPCQKTQSLRSELGIAYDTRVLLYSGNMGEKQGLELLVEAAWRLRDDPQLLFLLCGDGAARPRVEAFAEGLPNVRFAPLQPLNRLNELLNLADVHLLPQRAGAEDLVMPSKLTAILASGRPVLACASEGTELAMAAAAGGRVVPPGDPDIFAETLRDMLRDRALCDSLGESGRHFAMSHLERRYVLGQLVVDLQRLAATSTGSWRRPATPAPWANT
jgi:colanic acid biosynthesis glycosyl transferase WcaI